MEKPAFVYVTIIATTPEKLWQALINSEFVSQYFFGTSVESGWNPGDRVAYSAGDQVMIEGTVLKSEPPRLLSYTFLDGQSQKNPGEKPSRVTFEIEDLGSDKASEGGAVRLTVTHDEFAPGSTVQQRVSNGWPAILSSLKSLLETGKAINIGKAACHKPE